MESDPAAPRSAYVHVPFCARRCGYCDFTLVAGRGDLVGDYLSAIERETSAQCPPREVDTLYFGGGTPSQLPGEAFERLCELVLAWRPLAGGHEWTVEANPADVDAQWIARLAERGATRLSLGGQSFNPDKLKLLDRDHAPGDIAECVRLAREHGVDACVDLIFAAPGETLDEWSEDLDRLLEQEPEHVSTYGLTFEQGTDFWRRRRLGELVEADEELQREMYLLAIDRLTAAGLEHYEVSNFARPGHRSRHNLAYWRGDAYDAIGPGATRFVAGVRETNHRSTFTYLRRVLAGESPVAEREELDPEQRAREVLVFALRQRDGIDLEEFAERTGYEVDRLAGGAIEAFRREGFLERAGERLRLTQEGLLVSDAMWPELL